jgi:hypothetical protein
MRSNLKRSLRIGRLDLIGRTRRRRWSPELVSRGGVSPELIEIDAPGVKSSRAWVCRDQRDTRDPPGALAGLGGARGRGCDGGGGSVRQRSPVCGVLA